jgi:hypothetical protein
MSIEKIAFIANCVVATIVASLMTVLKVYIATTGDNQARWSGLLVVLIAVPVWGCVWLFGLVGLWLNRKKAEKPYIRITNQLFLIVFLVMWTWGLVEKAKHG